MARIPLAQRDADSSVFLCRLCPLWPSPHALVVDGLSSEWPQKAQKTQNGPAIFSVLSRCQGHILPISFLKTRISTHRFRGTCGPTLGVETGATGLLVRARVDFFSPPPPDDLASCPHPATGNKSDETGNRVACGPPFAYVGRRSHPAGGTLRGRGHGGRRVVPVSSGREAPARVRGR